MGDVPVALWVARHVAACCSYIYWGIMRHVAA